jgi:hypothetical protein
MLTVIMLSIIVLHVIILNAVVLNVIMLIVVNIKGLCVECRGAIIITLARIVY